MPAPDSLTTIGYVFTAEDMTGNVIGATQEAIEAAEAAITAAAQKMATSTEDASEKVGKSLKKQGALWETILFGDIVEGVKILDDKLDSFVESARKGISGVVEEYGSLTGVLRGAVKLTAKLAEGMIRANVDTGSFLKKVFALKKVTKVMKLGGGLFGAILGPFGPILSGVMRLFQPLIDILVETLSPAMETFSAIVKTAFAPLGMIAEIVAQRLAPLVVKFIAPFTSMLELLAVQAGEFLVGIFDVNKAVGSMGGFFQRLFPILNEVAQILLEVGQEIIGELLEAAAELGPELGDVFIDLLKVVKPLIKPLAQLAAAIITDIFPAVVKLGIYVTKTLIPVIASIVESVVPVIDKLTEKIETFYGNLENNLGQFYKDFIDPILTGIADVVAAFEMKGLLGGLESVWTAIKKFFTDVKDLIIAAGEVILDALGFGDVDLAGPIHALAESVTLPIKAIWKWLEDAIFNTMVKVLEWEPPIIGGTLGELIGIGRLEMPKLAEGGIVRDATTSLIGEAGPEAVVPLEPTAIERFIEPAFPDMEMPGLEEALVLLGKIERVLRGTLKVEMLGGGEEGGVPSRHTPMQEEPELDSAISMHGMGGF